ncbi:hypothetical protein ABG067_006597 [Albugo candida]|uniref:Uncharacterized protein n=1 Tax=Albugo candida TaxID=65357 RepID=A0A024GMR6_9STRA|nr:unnamed protein product [Albugo candida]|eukprot:CCI47999.1 unnamed protein product [Albugo candida]
MEEIDKLNENVCESVAAYIGTQFTSSESSSKIMLFVLNELDQHYQNILTESKKARKKSKFRENAIDVVNEELCDLEVLADRLDAYITSLGRILLFSENNRSIKLQIES